MVADTCKTAAVRKAALLLIYFDTGRYGQTTIGAIASEKISAAMLKEARAE
jgi:hypothetical protein